RSAAPRDVDGAGARLADGSAGRTEIGRDSSNASWTSIDGSVARVPRCSVGEVVPIEGSVGLCPLLAVDGVARARRSLRGASLGEADAYSTSGGLAVATSSSCGWPLTPR